MLPWLEVESFLERGGPVLLAIAAVLVLMWTLILERFLYLQGDHRALVEEVRAAWLARDERESWYAEQIRRGYISRVAAGANRHLGLIRSLVAACTLLGLLGTVTGMIDVFDVMALTGSSSARLMADSISRATLPTMAGMVAALSGLFPSARLREAARRERDRVADLLTRS